MPGNLNKQRRFLLPPTVLLASILLILALHRWLPLADLWGSAGRAIGIATILVALGVNIYCALEFRRRQTTIIPFHQSTALIATGLYRYSRNPIYLSMVVLLGGLAITLGTAAPWIVPPLFAVVISRLFIEKEEAMLADAFGRQYLDYCRRVRRWL
ncbi:MAG: isoprenylcysteine carboxylmethyltransferase family protein [Planctomycetales bacterium]|nr:isoprenylcysteine carboxylmethyltransferase family protein [Planctomycetales bacterium]